MLNILLFFMVYLVGVFRAFKYSPIYAIALYEAVYFFNPQLRWWGGSIPDLSYSFFVVILVMVLYLSTFKESNGNKISEIPAFKWIYFLILIYSITSFYAVLPVFHTPAMIDYIKLGIIISLFYKLCDSPSKLNILLYAYIFGAWYIGFQAWEVGRNVSGRVEGIGMVDSPDSNGTAAAIAPSIVFCLYFFWVHKKIWMKAIFAFAGVFIANGLVLINSRGAFLSVIVSIIVFMFYLYWSPIQKKNQKLLVIIIAIFGLMGTLSILDNSALERFYSMQNTEVNTEQESGSTRFIFWQSAIDMAKDFPLGTGYRGFEYYAPLYIPQNVDTGRSRNRAVHSSWFEVLTEIGYLGLFCFIMMLYSTLTLIKKLKRHLKETNNIDSYFQVIAIQGALLGFIVSMTFLNRARAEILYWLIIYTACAYNIYILKSKKITNENT